MNGMTIGYKVIRFCPAEVADSKIEDTLNDLVRQGFKIEHITWYDKTELMVFLYREHRQA